MATRASTTLKSQVQGSDANFRASCQFFEDTLVTTGGWVVTSDTGQMNLATVTVPGTANTAAGYRIYRMNDALQATAPVFVKVEFGTSSAGPWSLWTWLTIGLGSDGAGNITNIVSNRTPWGSNSNNANTTTVTNSYGSAAPNRFSIAMCVQGTNSAMVYCLCLERSKDQNGQDTPDGLMIIGNLQGITLSGSSYVILRVGPQPAVETGGLNYILSGINPAPSFGGDVGVGVINVFKGVSQQPGMNVLVVNSLDVAAEGNFNVSLYNVSHSYQHLNVFTVQKARVGVGTGSTDGNVRVAIRYD